MQTLIGIDVGTSGVKALALAPDGTVLGRAEETYPLEMPQPGWAEQDPELWWTATERALAALDADDVAGIGLSGQMHGLVVLDSAERVLRPAILWNDQRASAECVEIEESIGFARLVSLTGNRALSGFTAPKLLWLKHHEPATYRSIASVLLPKDYVRLRLTGEHAIDVADASGTLLFDVAHRRWSDEMLAALEVPADWLPTSYESPEVSGLTESGVPVAAGGGDQACGALGVGVDRPGPLSIALGTSGVVFATLEDYTADAEARLHTFCHAVPGRWHAMGVSLSAAGSVEWLRTLLLPDGEISDLVEEATRWAPGTEGVLFLPYLAGERTPHGDPHARGAFVGLSLRHDRGAMLRAVFEGVAYALRDSLELIRGLGIEPVLARVSGGGARSDLWLSIIASVLGIPLERTESQDGAAFGAALLGGVAAGVFADVREAVDACVRVTDTLEPNPVWERVYEEGYQRYRALYPALRPFEPFQQ
jgi:xylulokinase